MTAFTYQRRYLMLFCAGIVLPFIFALQNLLAVLLHVEEFNVGFLLLCALLMLLFLVAYYQCAQHFHWFERTGAYWVENGTVYLQIGRKTVDVKNVTWMRGTTVSAYGLLKSGMLVIQSEGKKIVLFSPSSKNITDFSQSSLLSLLETVLECNPSLKKDETLDFWYEI